MADVIHKPEPHSIYVRTDYIAPLDMAIPYALARSVLYGYVSESAVRTGLPQVDRRPQSSPLSMARARLPKAR